MVTQPQVRSSAFFQHLERQINILLRRAHQRLWSDPRRASYFEPLFDQINRGGFYRDIPRIPGQTPAWPPNEAYMQFFEQVTAPALAWLAASAHLAPTKIWRDLFPFAPEYEDPHIRVFIGQLMDTRTEVLVCSFTMSAAHSIERFSMAVPRFQIAYALDPLP